MSLQVLCFRKKESEGRRLLWVVPAKELYHRGNHRCTKPFPHLYLNLERFSKTFFDL